VSAYAKLRRRRQVFVDAYVKTGVGADAIRAINPLLKRPDVAASKMLANPEVKAAIAEKQAQAIARAGAREVRVIEELCHLAFFDPGELQDENGHYLPLNQLRPEVRRALQSIDVEDKFEGTGDARRVVSRRHRYKGSTKEGALKILLQYMKALPEQVQVSGPGGGPIETRSEVTDLEKARRIAFLLTMGLKAKPTTPLSDPAEPVAPVSADGNAGGV
jgi:hypothetical protein